MITDLKKGKSFLNSRLIYIPSYLLYPSVSLKSSIFICLSNLFSNFCIFCITYIYVSRLYPSPSPAVFPIFPVSICMYPSHSAVSLCLHPPCIPLYYLHLLYLCIHCLPLYYLYLLYPCIHCIPLYYLYLLFPCIHCIHLYYLYLLYSLYYCIPVTSVSLCIYCIPVSSPVIH